MKRRTEHDNGQELLGKSGRAKTLQPTCSHTKLSSPLQDPDRSSRTRKRSGPGENYRGITRKGVGLQPSLPEVGEVGERLGAEVEETGEEEWLKRQGWRAIYQESSNK